MSYKKYLNDNSKKWIDIMKITRVFIFHENVDMIAKAPVFFLTLLSCYSFCIIPS